MTLTRAPKTQPLLSLVLSLSLSLANDTQFCFKKQSIKHFLFSRVSASLNFLFYFLLVSSALFTLYHSCLSTSLLCLCALQTGNIGSSFICVCLIDAWMLFCVCVCKYPLGGVYVKSIYITIFSGAHLHPPKPKHRTPSHSVSVLTFCSTSTFCHHEVFP